MSKYGSDSSSESSSDSSDSDSSSEGEKKRKRKKKKNRRDEYALNVDDTKKDTRNQFGIIQCGHCRKPGHGIANCWELHGRPANYNNNRGNDNVNGNVNGRTPRRCWLCGSAEQHIARDCPTNPNNANTNNEADAEINNLFIGALWHYERKITERVKARLNAAEITRNKVKKSSTFIQNGKEYQSVDESTWYNIDTDNDSKGSKQETVESFDSKSWCKICEENEENSDTNRNDSTPKRMIEAEEELKKILGLIKNNYGIEANGELSDDDSSSYMSVQAKQERINEEQYDERAMNNKELHTKNK